jgi:flagellar biosynthesis protein FliR
MSVAGWLVFARCAGFASRAPGLSHPSVPRAVRVGVACLLTIALAPAASAVRTSDRALFPEIVFEFLIGSAIGMASSLLYDGAYAGGRMIDDYVGVKAIAPGIALVAPSGFGRVWSIAFTGGYFLFGAYRTTVEGFARSFVTIPPGTSFDAHAWMSFAMSLISTIVCVGVAVAGPAVALAFVTQTGLAALSRAIPRFSSFTLSFPIVFGVVLIATAMAVPLVVASSAHPVLLFPGQSR